VDLNEPTGLLLKALRFSANKHRDQRRKDSTQSPYINHPIDVAGLLWDVGGVRDSNTLTAAILHDTVEDTDTTPEEIAALFGTEVRDLVMEVTDDQTLPKAVRKQRQVDTAPYKSFKAKLIKIADKSCNLTDIAISPPPDWSMQRRHEYVLWCERVVNGLRGVNSALEQDFDKRLSDAKRVLEIKPG